MYPILLVALLELAAMIIALLVLVVIFQFVVIWWWQYNTIQTHKKLTAIILKVKKYWMENSA